MNKSTPICLFSAERQSVVAEALAWLRTPYHHRGTLKSIGADCAQFPLAVYAACGVIPWFDPGEYPPDWHLHRSEERYLAHAQRLAHEIEVDALQPGDFALFRIGRCFAHGAIVVAWPTIVHAVINIGVTLDSANGGMTAGKPVRAFTPFADEREI